MAGATLIIKSLCAVVVHIESNNTFLIIVFFVSLSLFHRSLSHSLQCIIIFSWLVNVGGTRRWSLGWFANICWCGFCIDRFFVLWAIFITRIFWVWKDKYFFFIRSLKMSFKNCFLFTINSLIGAGWSIPRTTKRHLLVVRVVCLTWIGVGDSNVMAMIIIGQIYPTRRSTSRSARQGQVRLPGAI